MTRLDGPINGTPVWVDIAVPSEEQRLGLMDFYRALLGWEWNVGAPEMGYYSIALHDGQPVLGLVQVAEATGAFTTYFATDHIEDQVAHATHLGATVLRAPTAVADLGVMALLLDPCGASHGLWQAGTFGGFGVAYEPGAPGWFDHTSDDPDQAAAYYGELLGHAVLEPNPAMRILIEGDRWFAGFSYDQVQRGAPQWNPIYVTDSLERVRDTARDLGATVAVEEMPAPGTSLTVIAEPFCHQLVTLMAAGHA